MVSNIGSNSSAYWSGAAPEISRELSFEEGLQQKMLNPLDLSIELLNDNKNPSPETLETLQEYQASMIDYVNGTLERSKEIFQQGNASEEQVEMSGLIHELRSPLNSIGISLEVLQSAQLPDEVKEKLLSVLIESYKHLEGVAKPLLPENHSLSTRLNPSALLTPKKLIGRVLSIANSLASADCVTINLVLNLPSKLHEQPLNGDLQKLCQILINLLGNAIKFTRKPGNVDLKVSFLQETADEIVLQFDVKDEGLGISKEDQKEKLFKKFSQAAQPTETSMKASSGMGLSLAQEFAALMGSKIEVDSEPGQGARFYFSLPLKKAKNTQKPNSPLLSLLPRFAKRNISILVAEDHLPTQKLYRTVFSQAECSSLKIVSTGEEAVTEFQQQQPPFDVAILDMHLESDITGWDTAKVIYKISLEKQIACSIIISSGDDRKELEKFQQTAIASSLPEERALGNVLFLGKPILFKNLILKINDLKPV